jgi:TolB protein
VPDRDEETPYFRVSPSGERKTARPLVLIFVLTIVSIGAISWMAFNFDGFVRAEDVVATRPQSDLAILASQTPSATVSPIPIQTSTLPVSSVIPLEQSIFPFGSIIFDAYENGYRHLWHIVPGETTARRLTVGEWDDREPAVSPDGLSIAFSSHRNGNWDLFVLDLENGEVRRMTATLGYEGNPTWSPDGQWLAYEAYYDGNFDIWLLPIDELSEPFRLTTNPAHDLSPSWSPDGRKIAFVSNRVEGFDIFLADLDSSENRFEQLTETPTEAETDLSFDPSGNKIAYAVRSRAQSQVYVMDLDLSEIRSIGNGDLPIWSPDGRSLAVVQPFAYENHIVSYNIDARGIPPLGIAIEGDIRGLDWLEENLILESFSLAETFPEADVLYVTEIETPVAQGRYSLVNLSDLAAPNPYLSDLANEGFTSLRARIISEVAWDFLANLDFAFVGVNDPLPPGFAYNDWLYTGRAFAISEAIVRAGWVEVIREDIAGQTYWRIYVRARFQDGSLGEPLRREPWDFSGRLQGDPSAYDEGGTYAGSIPKGYYIDFTGIAGEYGFLRQPALANWRTYYAGARFKEFALMDDLSWEGAMLEIYPPSAILTPTPFRTPTTTPTRTPWPTITPWWLVPTGTPTPIPTLLVTPTP